MFCHICGNKLVDGALFCSNCGNKVISTASDSLKPQNNEPEKRVTVSESVPLPTNIERIKSPNIIESVNNRNILQLLHKYFDGMIQNERTLYLCPKNASKVSIFPKSSVELFTNEDPLMVFNYTNKKSLDEGFIITPTTFAFVYGDWCNEFELSSIREAIHSQVILAHVMILEFFDGTVSSKLYLTGMRDPMKFVDNFNNFLLELNRPEIYSKQQEQIQNKDITSMLEISFKPYIGDNSYCFIGAPLYSNHRKYKQAIENFGIDPSTEIYMVYDESTFSNCKKGFAVCEDGIYYKQKTMGHFSWDEFKTMPIKTGALSFKLGALDFTTFKKDGNITYNALSKLQELLKA